jgi:hypothetical protein
MDKIDRLGWAAGISIHAYGRRIGIRTNEPAVLDRLPDLLPPGWESCFSPLVDHLFSLRIGGPGQGGRVRNFHLLYGGFTQLARSLDLEVVLSELEAHLHLYVGEYASNRVFVPPGVVGWRDRAILVLGPSRAGKTALVAALLRTGARYYSDEFAVLDPDGLVHPFPRRLSIRSRDGTTAQRCGPELFGSRRREDSILPPLPVGVVAVTRFQPGARWRPRPLTPGQAVLALLENTLPAQIDPEGSLHVMHRVVESAASLGGPRGEADETAKWLLEQLHPGPAALQSKGSVLLTS